MPNRLSLFQRLQRLGPIAKMPGFTDLYSLNHPDCVKHVFHTHYQNYIKTDFSYKAMRLALGKGLLTNDNIATWQPQRRHLQAFFHFQQIKSHVTTINTATVELLKRWQTYAATDQAFDLSKELINLGQDIAARSLLSRHLSPEHKQIISRFVWASNRYLGNSLQIYGWLFYPSASRFYKARAVMRQMVSSFVQERRATNDPPQDVLAAILNYRDEQTGQGLSDEEIIDHIVTFLIAGHETLTDSLVWTWYCLVRHPKCWHALRSEVQSTLQGNMPTADDLERLPYTRMAYDESLRLYPPTWVLGRQAIAEDEIAGFYIPAQQMLLMSPYALHRHPEFWERPSQYIPERFEERNNTTRPRFTYIPFGAGPRTCIASTFAGLQARLIIANIAQHFRLNLINDKEVAPLPLITLKPSRPILMQAKLIRPL